MGLTPRRQAVVDVKEVELTTLWGRVIEEVAANAPQHRAFLQLTKPLGLLHNDDQTTLLVAAPNLFAKDVLESRLRTVVSEVLTRELGSNTNIAVTVDETLEVVANSAPEVEVGGGTIVVREGGGAMSAYRDMLYGINKDNAQVKALYEGALKKYCKLDTLSMACIWQYWVEKI